MSELRKWPRSLWTPHDIVAERYLSVSCIMVTVLPVWSKGL